MTDLTSLIEKLEKAEGPNYALEVDIFKFFNPEYSDYVEGRGGLVHRYDGEDQRVLSNIRPPNVTASIDAAVSLAERVMPGRSVMMGWRQSSETKPWARVDLWPDPDATGATPAIALVLATLRALQSRGDA